MRPLPAVVGAKRYHYQAASQYERFVDYALAQARPTSFDVQRKVAFLLTTTLLRNLPRAVTLARGWEKAIEVALDAKDAAPRARQSRRSSRENRKVKQRPGESHTTVGQSPFASRYIRQAQRHLVLIAPPIDSRRRPDLLRPKKVRTA